MREQGTLLARETHRQRYLSHQLAKAGYDGGWRQYLVERKEAGLSNARISLELATTYQVHADATTVGDWLRQATQERAKVEEARGKRTTAKRQTATAV
jgi:hypothetical protein